MTSDIRAPLSKYIKIAFAIDFIAACLVARFIKDESFVAVYFIGFMMTFVPVGLLYEYGKKEPRSNLAVLFMLLGVAAGLVWTGVARMISLRENRVTTSAVVTDEGYNVVDNKRVRWIEYRYFVGRHQYITREESNRHAVADTIAINYDSTAPRISEPVQAY